MKVGRWRLPGHSAGSSGSYLVQSVLARAEFSPEAQSRNRAMNEKGDFEKFKIKLLLLLLLSHFSRV